MLFLAWRLRVASWREFGAGIFEDTWGCGWEKLVAKPTKGQWPGETSRCCELSGSKTMGESRRCPSEKASWDQGKKGITRRGEGPGFYTVGLEIARGH